MPRNIYLFSPIYDYVAQSITEQLLEMDRESNEEITMFINSPGGSVNAMFAIIDVMNIIKSPIRTITIGMAASAASVIASSGKTRLISENARFMIHEVWSFVGGSVSEMDESIKEMTKEQEKLINILSGNTGKTVDQIKSMIKKADKYFDAKEAKKFGLIDDIIKNDSAQILKLSDPINCEAFEITNLSEIELLKSGSYDHPIYGSFDITRNHLELMKKNFDSNIRGCDISIDYTHENEEGEHPAACWIKELIIKNTEKGTSLIAKCEFTPTGKDKVKSKEYKYVSADFVINYVTESGQNVPYVLRGGTLTNRPFIKEMNPIKLSERTQKKELDQMNKEALFNVLKEQHGIDVSAMEASVSDLKKEISDLQNKVKELNSLPAQKDEEINTLKDKLLNLTNEMNQKEKEVAFDELINQGKVVPAQKEKVLNKFGTAEELKEWYSDAPSVVNIKPVGSDEASASNDVLTNEEKKLVEEGLATKEEILANRKIKS